MWKRLPQPTREQRAQFTLEKRARIYADEDIEEGVVEWLRSKGVNVKSARELGHRGKPDSFQAALAFKEERFLLTMNAKDFMDDRKLPFHRTHGVLALGSGFRDSNQYGRMIAQLFKVIPYGDFYAGAKILVNSDSLSIKRIAADGNIVTSHYRVDGTYAFEWVND